MEMEDHSQHSHYTPIDLRHFISQKPSHFPSTIPPPPLPSQPDLFRNIHPSPDHAYHDMMMLIPRGGLQEFRADHSCNNNSGAPIVVTGDNSGGSNTVVPSAQTNTVLGGLDGDAAFGGDGGTGRWPRQETLTLLEIRSRLDSKFKEANQKGPLWDEVSRIMSEEHGYQRSGKKCREKFENLYKYYKKTKEGKAGRQDGKHYRFFRQLEALYGESSNANHTSLPETQYGVGISSTLRYHSTSNASRQVQETTVHSQKLCDSLSLSNNSSEFDTSSYEDNDLSTATLQENNDSTDKRRKRRGGWKAKIKDFIDSQMKKLIERQEAWLDKLTKTLEQKEQERLVREEEWRKQEAARIDKEHKFWAKERAWIEARDSALMDALKKLSGRETVIDISSTEGLMGGGEINNPNESRNEDVNETEMNGKKGCDGWEEIEITRLVQIRSSMESKFQQSGCIEEALWEDIEAKMACFGYKKSALMCKEKWERINNRVIMRKTNKEGNKKRKENSRESCYHVNFESNESAMYNNQGGYCDHLNGQSPPPNSSNAVANSVSESCFRYFICEGDSLWENYGLKLNSGDHNQRWRAHFNF